MRTRIDLFLVVFILLSSFENRVFAALKTTTVLAVGINKTAKPSLKKLRFADRDARRFAEAMRSVGYAKKVHIRTDVSRESFRQALKETSAALPKDSRFILYFSGHADEEGLHFQDGPIDKDEWHELLRAVPSSTKISMLDTCFSGAISSKGVERAPEFELPKINLDAPTGMIHLAASSGRQLAYESDRHEGGIFTHNIIEGLYGKADANSDGLVTVDELYHYAYRTTKWESLNLPIDGKQDPAIRTDLKGAGAVVMSFPMRQYAPVRLAANLSGAVTIASESGMYFLNYEKTIGQPKDFRLPLGDYRVAIRQPGRHGEGKFSVQEKGTNILTDQVFAWNSGGSEQTFLSRGEISTREASEEKSHWVISSTMGQRKGSWGPKKSNDRTPGVAIGIDALRAVAPLSSPFNVLGGVGFLSSRINRGPNDDLNDDIDVRLYTYQYMLIGKVGARIVYDDYSLAGLYGTGQSWIDQKVGDESKPVGEYITHAERLVRTFNARLGWKMGDSILGCDIGYEKIANAKDGLTQTFGFGFLVATEI